MQKKNYFRARTDNAEVVGSSPNSSHKNYFFDYFNQIVDIY